MSNERKTGLKTHDTSFYLLSPYSQPQQMANDSVLKKLTSAMFQEVTENVLQQERDNLEQLENR